MILICEPQCIGFEHVDVNGALVGVYRRAFPTDRILFIGERSHVDEVQLFVRSSGITDVDFEVMPVAPRRCSNLRRFFIEKGVYQNVFRRTSDDVTHVVFCSITSPGLYWVKMFVRRFRTVCVLAVLHGIVESAVRWKDMIRHQVFFWFRIPLLCAPHPRLKYLVFGEFIKNGLVKKFPSLKHQIVAMDLPYKFRVNSVLPRKTTTSIRFGSFGVGSRSKGTDQFFDCAARIARGSYAHTPVFVLVGPLMDKDISIPSENVLIPSPNVAMTPEQYDREANLVDYALFFHRQDHYRFSTSAALFDAFSYLKPIIALRSPVFEYYFDLIGDIGYLCADFQEVETRILQVLKHFNSSTYDKQRANILSGRSRLTMEAISSTVGSFWSR